jgi:hypothetical protein
MCHNARPRMKTVLSSRAFLLGSFLFAVPSALGCSSSSSSATSNLTCGTLGVCCLGMTSAAAAACNAIANNAVATTCASTLVTYQQGGLCGGTSPIGDGGHPTGFDTGLPCQATNTCPTGTKDGGAFDTGLPCQITGTCKDGGGMTMPGVDGGHDAGVDATDTCGTTPALHPEVEAGVYCPFTATGNIHCTAGQECCETPSTTANGSTCETVGTSCPVAGSIDWVCQGPLDCASSSNGPVCCGAGTVAEDNTCGFDRGSGFVSTHCSTLCQTGEVTVCSAATGDCASGTCVPFKIAGIVLGACQ